MGSLIQKLHISNYGIPFLWEPVVQPCDKVLPSCSQFVTLVREDKSVVHIIHGSPFEIAIGDVIEHSSHKRIFPAHFTDIVNTHIPFVVVAFKGVGITAYLEMFLENEHALAGFG